MELKYGPYSPTRLDTAVCGYAFRRQYIEQKKALVPRDSLAADRGAVVHEVLEKITQRFIKREPVNWKDISIWTAESLARFPVAQVETDAILKMAQSYIEHPPMELTTDASIELKLAVKYDGKEFTECDYDDPKAFARGKADIMMVSDNLEYGLVYDHKTQPHMEQADTFQLGFYAWVISKIYPFLKEIKTVLHFVRYGKYSEPFVWTKDHLEFIEHQILSRVIAVEMRHSWDPTPHSKCQYCPYLLECPLLSDLVEITPEGRMVSKSPLSILGDTHRAQSVAGYINVLEDVLKRLKEDLRQHVEFSGTGIATHDKIYSFIPTETIDWNSVNKGPVRNILYDIFTRHGIDPKTYMSFNQTASKGIWRLGNEMLLKELSDVLPKTVSTEFKAKKI